MHLLRVDCFQNLSQCSRKNISMVHGHCLSLVTSGCQVFAHFVSACRACFLTLLRSGSFGHVSRVLSSLVIISSPCVISPSGVSLSLVYRAIWLLIHAVHAIGDPHLHLMLRVPHPGAEHLTAKTFILVVGHAKRGDVVSASSQRLRLVVPAEFRWSVKIAGKASVVIRHACAQAVSAML